MKDEETTGLGGYLRSLRQAGGLTLRAVEKKAGVSNAFLSQLESGKVKRPSPLVLFKLASAYGVAYEDLMERAGYPVPERAQDTRSDKGLFHRLGPLTKAEEESLLEYLSFLRSRSGKGRGNR